MIVSKDMHDEVALRILRDFTQEAPKDRRHLALAALSKLTGVQQILDREDRLEVSPTVRGELDRMMTEILTCVDIILSKR
tara:strand:- start:4948 stop:5187 length:240 start_codon:yes stop_codon:yes gene_type:complete